MPHFGEFERTLINPLRFEEDAGADQELIDMSVSAAPAAGSEMSYHLRIDDESFIELYAEADGAGGLQNQHIRFGTFDLRVNQINNRGGHGTGFTFQAARVKTAKDFRLDDNVDLMFGTFENAKIGWDNTNARLLLVGGNFVDETADGMTANPETDAEDGFMMIRIGTTNYQIPVYAA